MDKIQKAKRRADALRAGIRMGGAEYDVYVDRNDSRFVNKIAKGVMTDVLQRGEISQEYFDIDEVPEGVRRKLIGQHLLGKILHVLYPQFVPDRKSLSTKNSPIFKQEKVTGIKAFDDVEHKELESKELETSPSARFRIKKVITKKEPTMEGKRIIDDGSKKMNIFLDILSNFSVTIDAVHGVDNFIKNEHGEYLYIDTFSFPNPEQTITSLVSEIKERYLGGDLSESDFKKLRTWIERFNKVVLDK